MGFKFNPTTSSLDLVGGGGGDSTINNFNALQVDQTGGTGDTHGILAGSVNGTNKVFTVSNGSYALGSLSVYLNGQLLTQGSSEDWTETTPASGTFTFVNAPLTGDRITAVYTKYTTSDTDYVNVDGDTMTGELVLASGTTTEPPLKLQTGDLLTTPEQGAVEFGKTLMFTPGVDRRSVSLANGVVMSDSTAANTTTETTIFTETVSADVLYKGSKWHTKVSGYYSTANASDTFNFNLKVGGTTVKTLTSTAENVTDGFFRAEFYFTVRSAGATGSVQAAVEAVFNDTPNNSALTSPTTIDTTTAEDITVTVQWSAANASNTLTLTQGHTEIFGVERV